MGEGGDGGVEGETSEIALSGILYCPVVSLVGLKKTLLITLRIT